MPSPGHILIASLGSSGLAHPDLVCTAFPVSQDQTSLEDELGDEPGSWVAVICVGTPVVGFFRVLQRRALGELEGLLESPSSPTCSVSPSSFFCRDGAECPFGPLGHVGLWYPVCQVLSGLTGRVTA